MTLLKNAQKHNVAPVAVVNPKFEIQSETFYPPKLNNCEGHSGTNSRRDSLSAIPALH
jgi:hypothetical protein